MPPEQHKELLAELQKLNDQIEQSYSIRRSFLIGIFYGIGFFIGSAIIATIALGILGPWIADVPWIQHAFVSGMHMIGK